MHKVAPENHVVKLFAVAMSGLPGRRPGPPRHGSRGCEREKILVCRSTEVHQEFWLESIEILDGTSRKASQGAKFLMTNVLGVSRTMESRVLNIRGRMGDVMENPTV